MLEDAVVELETIDRLDIITALEEAIYELDIIIPLEEAIVAGVKDECIELLIIWLEDTREDPESIMLLAMELIVAVLDIIIIVLELPPLQVPNIGLQFRGAQY